MNNLPEGWRWLALGEVTREESLRVGRRQEVKVLSSTKHHGLVPSDQYFKNRTIYSSDLSNYKLVPRNCFAYATNHLAEGSIGLQSQYDLACVSPVYTVFSCDLNQVDENYMFRLLKSPPLMVAYGAHEQASVDRRGAIRYRDFSRIYVLLPTKAEQRRIAEILDALDDQIICQGKVVEKLGSVMQGLAEEQLSLVTRNVKTAYLGEISNVGSGVTLGGEVESGVELPYLRVANVQDGYIDTSEMKKVRVSRSEVARYLLEAGDVLLTEGGDIDKLGRGAVWDGRIDPCLCQNHIFRVRCRQDVVRPEFLAAYTGSTKGKAYFLSIAKQTTNLATINSTQLKEMPIPLPSIAEQDSFIRLMKDVKSRLDSEVAAADKLVALKQGLAEDLLTGRVRVPEAEAVVESL